MKDFFDEIGEGVDLDENGQLVIGEKNTDEQAKEAKQDDKPVGKEEKQIDDKREFTFDDFKGYVKTKYERELSNEDDLKTYFDKATKADELEQRVTELMQESAEFKSLASKGTSGRDWFVSDDEFIRQQFLKTKGDKFSEAAMKVLSGLSPERVEKLSPKEAIRTQYMVENPELEASEVDELIAEEYGEGDVDELSGAAKAKMKINANNAKRSLKELYSGIEIPKAVDFGADRATRKESWAKPLVEIINGIDKIKLTEDLSFDVTPEMKQGMDIAVMNELLASQIDPSEEAASVIAGSIRSKILEKHFDKIIGVVNDAADERAKEKYRKEVHNDKGLNNDTRTDDVDEDGVISGSNLMTMF